MSETAALNTFDRLRTKAAELGDQLVAANTVEEVSLVGKKIDLIVALAEAVGMPRSDHSKPAAQVGNHQHRTGPSPFNAATINFARTERDVIDATRLAIRSGNYSFPESLKSADVDGHTLHHLVEDMKKGTTDED